MMRVSWDLIWVFLPLTLRGIRPPLFPIFTRIAQFPVPIYANRYTKQSVMQALKFKSCPLCKVSNHLNSNHFLSECHYLPEDDRKFIARARLLENADEEYVLLSTTQNSVVRNVTIHDVLQGNVHVPFANHNASISMQNDCRDLHCVWAHLRQGTWPSLKQTNIKNV